MAKVFENIRHILTLETCVKKEEMDGLSEKELKKLARKRAKLLDKKLKNIEIVENAPDLDSITINVEWKKSKTWGSNPNVEIKVKTENPTSYNRYYGKASGCGYDKESAAIQEALNQCPAVLKVLYSKKEDNFNTANRDLFGYGSGYGCLPYFESGVGVSCYYKIWESVGYKMEHIASGKTFDVYTVSRINDQHAV